MPITTQRVTHMAQQTTRGRSFGWLVWAALGGGVGWAVGFLGFAMHCAVFIPGPVPLQGPDSGPGPEVTAYGQIYGQTVHQETGPFPDVLHSCSRRMDWIGWPVVVGCVVVGAAGAGLWAARGKKPPPPARGGTTGAGVG